MGGLPLLRSPLLDRAGLPLHGFTTRRGGVSTGPFATLNLGRGTEDDEAAVAENHRLLAGALGLARPVNRITQVHGVQVVEAPCPEETEADGIYTGDPELAVGVQTADCVPVLLGDPSSRLVAALHAGWRGAAGGILRVGVETLVGRGADRDALVAAVGPCICRHCFEVGPEVAEQFPGFVSPKRGAPGKHLVDLGGAVVGALVEAGLAQERVERLPICNQCRRGDLYSYRGSGGTCGRGMGFIAGTVRRPVGVAETA